MHCLFPAAFPAQQAPPPPLRAAAEESKGPPTAAAAGNRKPESSSERFSFSSHLSPLSAPHRRNGSGSDPYPKYHRKEDVATRFAASCERKATFRQSCTGHGANAGKCCNAEAAPMCPVSPAQSLIPGTVGSLPLPAYRNLLRFQCGGNKSRSPSPHSSRSKRRRGELLPRAAAQCSKSPKREEG